MAKNLNCAALSYDCVFSITAEDGRDEFMIKTVQEHAEYAHPELIDDDNIIKPAVKAKLMELLNQSKYTESPS